VCTSCKFHHLARKWTAGGRVPGRQRRSVEK
jgi:hypothetical protein